MIIIIIIVVIVNLKIFLVVTVRDILMPEYQGGCSNFVMIKGENVKVISF